MKHLAATAALLLAAALPALATEATFERNLSVNGHVELSVSTGSGNIHLTRGSGQPDPHLRQGQVTTGGDNEDACARSRPILPSSRPATSSASAMHHENLAQHQHRLRNPGARRSSFLNAGSGSGDVNVEGVGENAKLSTGSGNIHATGLHGGFSVNTGSGNIYVEQSGQGEVKAQTGSGNIELQRHPRRPACRHRLRQHQGARRAPRWTPSSKPARATSNSGPANAGFTLDASTGSGEHSHRSRDGRAGIVRPPPHHRQSPRRRAHCPRRNRLRRHSRSTRVSTDGRLHPGQLPSLFLRRDL